MSNDKWIYLMSSNARKDYILDILKVLSLPYGVVQHFRYQLKWIDKDIREILLKKGHGLNDKLKDISIVVCYLYQEEKNATRDWLHIYPIRIGKLVTAYKTGNTDNDIAYFYFELTNYFEYHDREKLFEIVKKTIGDKWSSENFAFLNTSIENQYIANVTKSKTAFHAICDSFNFEQHFKSPTGEKTYYPIFCFIDGFKYYPWFYHLLDWLKENCPTLSFFIKRNKFSGKVLKPKYDPLSQKSFYEIWECNQYLFEYSMCFPIMPPNFDIRLFSDNKIFSTPSEYKLNVSSRYNEESWTLISSLLERNVWTIISFKTELPVDNDKEPLNIVIDFPIKVKRKILYRIFDILSDIGFAMGTGAIALAKVIENKYMWWDNHWVWFVIVGYSIFVFFKFIIKFWRG